MTLTGTFKKYWLLHLILLFAILQLMVTLLTDGFALSFDEAMWHYIGRNWFRHGMAPYSGGVDNKSPLIFAVFGLSDILFGVNYWFPRVLATACQSVSLYYIYKLAKHIAGEQAGLLAISFYGLSLLWHGTGGRYVAFTETYDVLFITIAFYKCIAGQTKTAFFIGGLLAGIGLGFRLSAVFGILTIALLLARKNWRHALLFCLGVFTALLLLVICAMLAGIHINDFITYGLADNFGHGSATDHSFLWKLENFSNKFFYSELILFYPLVLAYIFIKKQLDVFILWFILEFVGINIIGIYDPVHFKDILPPLALMSAFAVNYLVNNYHIPFKTVMIITWITFFPKLLEPLVAAKKLIAGTSENPKKYNHAPYIKPEEGDRKKLGEWVKAQTSVHDQVFVAGFGAQVQVYSERVSPTIHFNATQTNIARQRIYADLKKNHPALILIPRFDEYEQLVSADMRGFIDKMVKADYYLYANQYNYLIYKIKKEPAVATL